MGNQRACKDKLYGKHRAQATDSSAGSFSRSIRLELGDSAGEQLPDTVPSECAERVHEQIVNIRRPEIEQLAQLDEQ